MTTVNRTTNASSPSMLQSLAFPISAPQREILVVIDTGTEGYAQLVAGVVPGARLLLLDSGADGAVDGMARISEAIAQHSPQAIHLIAHGAPGCLYLGNTELSLNTLAAHASSLSHWFSPTLNPASTANSAPSLVLYGCHVGAGDAGEEFVQKLHQLTGANVFAASGPVGAAAQGGSWQLDVQAGAVAHDATPASLAISPQAQATYAGVLGWVVGEKEVSDYLPPLSTAPTFNPANDLVSNEEFGASVSIFGEYAVVGIPLDDPGDDSQPATGAVYLYKQVGGNWQKVQRLTVPQVSLTEATTAGASPLEFTYGSAVAITGFPASKPTSYRIVVGDPTGVADKNPNDQPTFTPAPSAGRVYVYDLNPSTGVVELKQRLDGLPDGRAASGADDISDDAFGSAVAVSGDVIVVGAPNATSYLDLAGSETDAGAVYIFEKQPNSTVWTRATISLAEQQSGEAPVDVQKIAFQNTPSRTFAPVGNNLLGTSVAIDGNTIIIGAPGAETNDPAVLPNGQIPETGAAYIFTKKADGKWSLDDVLRSRDFSVTTNAPAVGQDTGVETIGSEFGRSVSISGNYAIVGANLEDLNPDTAAEKVDAGAAYIFERQANGKWKQIQRITAPNPNSTTASGNGDATPLDEFGFSVSISGDFIMVGAPTAGKPLDDDELAGSGSVYIFQRDPNAPVGQQWVQVAVTAADSVVAPNGPLTLSGGPLDRDPVPFGRPPRNGTNQTDLDRTFGESVSIYQDPVSKVPQAIAGAPSDVAVIGQDDTTGQQQGPTPNPAIDGRARTANDPADIQQTGSVYFFRTRPEVIDIVFKKTLTGDTVAPKQFPRGSERGEDFFASDANVAAGYSFTILYNQTMDTSSKPAITFVDPNAGTNNFGAPTGTWVSINGGTNNAYVITYPLTDNNLDIDNIDLEIRGAKGVGNVEQEEALPTKLPFLKDAFDIDTVNPSFTVATSADANRDVANGLAIGPRYFNTETLIFALQVSEPLLATGGINLNQITANNFTTFGPGGTLPQIDFGIDPTQEGNATVVLGAGTLVDVAGNLSAPVTVEAIYDITGPTVAALAASNGAGAIAPTQPINSPTFTVTADFTDNLSPKILDFDDLTDVVVVSGNATISGIAPTATANQFTFTVTPNNPAGGVETEIELAIAAGAVQDLATNTNAQSAPIIIKYDTKSPTVTLALKPEFVATNISGPFVVVATFSEAVAPGFLLDDLVVTGGNTIDSIVAVPNTNSYEITLTPANPGVNAISVRNAATTDIAGNASTASADLAFTFVPPVNNPPIITVTKPADAVQGDEKLTFSAATANGISVTDPDVGPANPLLVKLTVDPLKGSFTLGSIAGLTFVTPGLSNDGVDDASLTFTGTLANVNAALEGLKFNPVNLETTATITVNINDQGFTGPAPLNPKFDEEIINVTITRVISPAEHDFDNNGTSDLIWSDGSGNNFVWFLDRDETNITVLEQGAPFAIPTGFSTQGSGDFNQDGTPDLVLQDASGNVQLFRTTPLATPNTPPRTLAGTLVPPTGAPSKGAGWNVVGVGDFGGPVTAPPASKPQSDILWRNTATGEVSVWYMNGEGFVEDRPIAGPTIRDQNWQIEGVGNFNDDLQADIIWRNRATGQNLVWLMDGAAVRTAVEIPAVSREWTLAGSGDYNGDRKSDLVWRNQSTGENVVWLMNGTTINRRVGIDPLASGATIVQN